MNFYDRKSEFFKEIFNKTTIVRKPITGIVSGFHQLPYILIAPDENNDSHAIEINGKINVSPKFIISPSMMSESFGDVFDPETFDKICKEGCFHLPTATKKMLKLRANISKLKTLKKNRMNI